MNVRNCKKCGRMFNYVMGQVICPRCKEDQEAKFLEVKNMYVNIVGLIFRRYQRHVK